LKRLLIILVFGVSLWSFNFSAPPASEEVMEPSVLGDEVEVNTKIKSSKKGKNSTKYDKFKVQSQDEPTEIVVEHKSDFAKDLYIPSDYPKIALMVPRRVIKKYANSVADSILSYLLYSKGRFDFELFDCVDENPKHIVKTLNTIRHKGYSLVIAPMTQRGARWIAKYEKSLLIYIPTVNKKEVPLDSDNIIFGGIDYEEQIDKLLTFAGDKIAIFNDKSQLSNKIASFIKNESFSDISYEMIIKSAKINLKPYLKDNHRLDDASIFLNMPIVKTSLLASQLSVYDIKYKNLLLTQIAYNPLIFSLTQIKDRKMMYIANSIGKSDFVLKDINLLFGTNIDFAWVNYSTHLGMDYLFSHYITNSAPIFLQKVINNQVQYDIDILKPTVSSFKKIDLKL
jgi:hypothetical protein